MTAILHIAHCVKVAVLDLITWKLCDFIFRLRVNIISITFVKNTEPTLIKVL